jgi:hypothetical protein
MSVDFRFPDVDYLVDGQDVCVPVMLLSKKDLRNFDIHDEEQRALSILTSEENTDLTVLGVESFLAGLLEEGEQLSREARLAIGTIIRNRGNEPIDRAKQALAPEGVLGRIVGRAEDPTQRRNIEALITQLANGFLLLTRLTYHPRERRLVKLSYDAEHRTELRLNLGLRRVLSSFGLVSRREKFDHLVVGLGESYHAEAELPADVYVAEFSLEPTRHGEDSPEEPVTDKHRSRPHVRARSQRPGDEGRLTVLVHARREGLLVPLWLSAVVISVALGFVPSRAKEHDLDGQTMAALLLVPFALAAFYVRSAENSYVTGMLRGVRLAAGVPVAAGVLIISMIGLGFLRTKGAVEVSESALDVARWAAISAGGATGLLTLALVAPLLGRCVRPAVRRMQRVTRRWPRGRRIAAACGSVAAIAGLGILIIRPGLPI